MDSFMESFFEDENSQLYLNDCLNVFRYFLKEEKSFDMIFADPPYFLSNGGMSMHSGRRVPVDKGNWDKSKGFLEDRKFTYKWISQCRELLKENGTIWISGTMHNIHMIGSILQELDFALLNEIVWFKPNGPPNLACRYFAHSHETLLWAKRSKKAKHSFHYELLKNWETEDPFKNSGRQMRSLWSIPLTPKREKTFGKHPTQKPQELLKRIIFSCTKEGDLILDPFCGSGTTGVVAKQCNRKFIGIDSERSFLELAQKRIEHTSSSLLRALF